MLQHWAHTFASTNPQVLGSRIVAPLLAAAGLLLFVQKNGKHLVDAPQLCPQLANTLAAASMAQAKKQS